MIATCCLRLPGYCVSALVLAPHFSQDTAYPYFMNVVPMDLDASIPADAAVLEVCFQKQEASIIQLATLPQCNTSVKDVYAFNHTSPHVHQKGPRSWVPSPPALRFLVILPVHPCLQVYPAVRPHPLIRMEAARIFAFLTELASPRLGPRRPIVCLHHAEWSCHDQECLSRRLAEVPRLLRTLPRQALPRMPSMGPSNRGQFYLKKLGCTAYTS